jgi:ribosome-associated protein
VDDDEIGPGIRDIAVRDDGIRLGQFLKLADAVEQGSDVRLLLDQERVKVNGEIEGRRGHRLRAGDVVTIGDGQGTASYRVSVA